MNSNHEWALEFLGCERDRKCWRCEGTGQKPRFEQCKECSGLGFLWPPLDWNLAGAVIEKMNRKGFTGIELDETTDNMKGCRFVKMELGIRANNYPEAIIAAAREAVSDE